MAASNPAPDLLTFQTMYLCGVAYMADPALMPDRIKNTQVPPSGGRWKCLWGPVQNDDDANLAFVAGFYTDPALAPEFICLAIRGTDVDVDDICGILEQIWEGLDVADPQPMPWALRDSARVANGTLEGFDVIKGLTDPRQPPNQQTLAQFLTAFFALPANANVKWSSPATASAGASPASWRWGYAPSCCRTFPARSSRSRSQPRRRATSVLPISTTSCSCRHDDTRTRSISSRSAVMTSMPSAASTEQHAGHAGPHLARRRRHGGGIRHHGCELCAAGARATDPHGHFPGRSLGSDRLVRGGAAQRHLATYLALLTGYGRCCRVAEAERQTCHESAAHQADWFTAYGVEAHQGKLARLTPPPAAARSPRRSRRGSAAASSRACASNQRAQHLRGATADREHAHVARHALERQLARIAARAEHLQRVVDDADRGFAREDLRLRGEHRIGKSEPSPRERAAWYSISREAVSCVCMSAASIAGPEIRRSGGRTVALLHPVGGQAPTRPPQCPSPPCRRRRAGVVGVHQVGEAAPETQGGSTAIVAGTSRFSNASSAGMPRKPIVCSRRTITQALRFVTHREEAADTGSRPLHRRRARRSGAAARLRRR